MERKADIRTIHRLYQEGLLNEKAFDAACRILRPSTAWFAWANHMLLFFGSTLVLAGIVFFFAYNWSSMGKFLKFGLIEFGIAACVAVSYIRGTDRLSGKVLILSSSVLAGVLLAVYGQIYQTGADAFELFRGWAILILPWVVLSEFAALWVLWLIITNAGIILYWQQVGYPNHSLSYETLFMTIALLNGLFLILREKALIKGLDWLRGRWLRITLLLAVLVPLSVPTILLILERNRTIIMILTAFIWTAASISGYICYRFRLRDMTSLSIIVMNVCIILLALTGKLLFEIIGSDAAASLLFALIILGVASGAAVRLRKIKAAMTDEMEGDNV
ncbi:MAG: DUF2157 domain-containing protein [Deferribacteres bacterium]|nr:DUF2157 domain-containing protein [Deferribacteres bacterium]